mgnify:CR=1 FL=1
MPRKLSLVCLARFWFLKNILIVGQICDHKFNVWPTIPFLTKIYIFNSPLFDQNPVTYTLAWRIRSFNPWVMSKNMVKICTFWSKMSILMKITSEPVGRLILFGLNPGCGENDGTVLIAIFIIIYFFTIFLLLFCFLHLFFWLFPDSGLISIFFFCFSS